MKEHIERILETQIAGYSEAKAQRSFDDLGVDSFDLIDLRAAVEVATGESIDDPVWTTLRSPADLLNIFGSPISQTISGGAFSRRRSHAVNMPQMAASGLSEAWLFKEIGDFHWSLISEGLGMPSSHMLDGNGERLYATFTRIRVECTPLRTFAENQDLTLDAELQRYGSGIFVGMVSGQSISAKTMSSFAKRSQDGSNKNLAKGQPTIPDNCPIPALDEKPRFVSEYGEIRRQQAKAQDPLFSCEYNLNPYYDINGVGLVYFAAYPLIADTCEMGRPGGRSRAIETSTAMRDVFYFSNANPDDTLRYSLLSEVERGNSVETEALISNASDDTPMALVRSVKVRNA